MKTKVIFLVFSIFFTINTAFAQKKKDAKSIINEKVAIKKYHNKAELQAMQKGELLTLYIERIESLVKTLPYIAFATKPGVTMTTLGIPNTSDNRKMLDMQFEETDKYLGSTKEFQNTFLPYSDTQNLIAAILFYEEIMKSLHTYSEFR
ncbi:hypothetical protein PW52_13400 [Tamlana sedimentorum]|uniref:Gliding motility-associated protein GldM N-terminal domain-containing protein n=1 Tax=Neotamlana sedimentorum TaxID=1435349 RepID=A0A0D7W658_9FLAO|nr:hypothetical protein [Tamlana sedimentorum]KJD34188.1 hypothetical protein PW52_13400 [Tamlana sedimentorum]